jgi:N-acetylneuraminic acid mutarotase
MSKNTINLFLGLVISYTSFSQDIWIQRDSVNGPVKGSCASFVLQHDGYVIGGLDDFGFNRKMYSYSPVQNNWDNEESIGGLSGSGLSRGSASSFAIGNKGYVCLGQGDTNPYFKDLWEYDLATGAWTQKADFIGTARRQAISFTINSVAYVGTGQDLTGLKKDFYKYEPSTNIWTQLNDFAGTARRQAVGFQMGDNGYIGTGDDGVLRTDFWMYTPTTDTWMQKANFPGTARAGATGWGIFPTGFIATGEDVNYDYKKDVWEYNYFGNAWIQRTDFIGSGRKNAVSFVIDGVAYLGTGYNGIFLDDFYAYFGIVGMTENTSNFVSSIYPNPAKEISTIKIHDENPFELKLQFYSITGEELTSKVEANYTSINSISINTSNLPAGNYFYTLVNSSNNKKSTGKLIVL